MALILALFAGAGCAGERQPAAPPAVPVRVAHATRRTVALELRAIGTMEANRSVDIKALVGGTLQRVAFGEGDVVRRGQLLFQIDPRPYQVAHREARARLTGELARLQNAERELARARGLTPDVVSRAELEKTVANHDAAAAAVTSARAAVATARLNLSYSTIRAPIAGRAGSLIVNEGNLVKANAETPLVVLREIAPIKVSFSAPERQLDEVRAAMRGAGPELRVVPRDERAAGAAEPHRGELYFVDNAVDRTTGTVLLKGRLPNQDEALWPGVFVEVTLRLGQRRGATVIPSQAVQSGQQGSFVYRVKPDQTVEMRTVQLGPDAGGGAVVVERGIAPGDTVVTDGQLRLRPGARVARQPEPRAENDPPGTP